MGGRADPPKMGLENIFRFHLLNLGTRGTPRKSNDIKHDKPYERAHKNHSSPPSEVHVRNFHVRNKGFIALSKGNKCVFISPDHKAGYFLGGVR